MGRFHSDVLAGAVLLVFCAAVFWLTTTFREVPAMLSQNVPPTFFPRLVLAAIALLSLALIASGLQRRPEPGERIHRAMLGTAAILMVAVALVAYLGMLATVFLVSIVLPLYWGERSRARIAGLAIGLPLLMHVIFALALGMRFPRGTLW